MKTLEAAVCGCYDTPRSLSATTSSPEADLGGEEEPRRVLRRPRDMFRSRISSEKKIIEPFKNQIERPVVVSGNNIPGTGSLGIQASI